MKNVVAYVRVSTDGQVGEDKFGIEAQKNKIMEYCAKNDMQVSEWYVDEGESGAKESRPQLDRLLFGEIANPPVEAVVVYKSDRISRDMKFYFYYMMLLEKKGIALVSASEPVVDDETGLGNIYRALMMFVAEQERKNITRRTNSGRTIKAAKGGYSCGKPPFGYKVENKGLVIVEEEANAVALIFKLRNNGATYQQIMDKMNSEGWKTKSGGKFAISTIQVILGNENLYRGMYKYGNSEWVEGVHQPILAVKA